MTRTFRIPLILSNSFVPIRRFHRQKCCSLTIPAIGDIFHDVRSADCVRNGQQRRAFATGRPCLSTDVYGWCSRWMGTMAHAPT